VTTTCPAPPSRLVNGGGTPRSTRCTAQLRRRRRRRDRADLAGIRARLPYVHALGVDAIWLTRGTRRRWPTPGYDVADYRDIEPVFGTLATRGADREAHALDLRIIIDIVAQPLLRPASWFREAVTAGTGWPSGNCSGPRTGRGPRQRAANNCSNDFRRAAWTRVPDGQWYLHLFAPNNPTQLGQTEGTREFEDILRFWFNVARRRRIDSAAVIVKDPELADFDPAARPSPHPFEDRTASTGCPGCVRWPTFPDRR